MYGIVDYCNIYEDGLSMCIIEILYVFVMTVFEAVVLFL